MEKIKELQRIIDNSSNIVFFGGAGVSTASGIKDFRGKNGIYKEHFNYPPEYLLSLKCFYKEPNLFFDFYKSKMNCLSAKPNLIHKYLTKLEERGKLKAIITQNIDGLHQKSGSKRVIEIHGSIYDNYCTECGKKYSAEFIFNSSNIPKCECGGIIKPDVILYGENLSDSYLLSEYFISKSDTLIVAGTSLTVEPAGSLVRSFKGKNLIIINNDKTPYDSLANLTINDDLVSVFRKLK